MQFARLSCICFDIKFVRLIAVFLITPPTHFPSSISTTANLVYHRLDNIVRNRSLRKDQKPFVLGHRNQGIGFFSKNNSDNSLRSLLF